jgi:hypothetical protein
MLTLRRLIILGGAIAWLVLTIIALVQNHPDSWRLAAWGDIGGSIGLLAFLLPVE